MSLVVFGLKVKAAVYSPVSPRTGWITLDSTIVRGDGPSQSDLRSPIRTAKARTARTRRRRSFLPDLLGCGGAGVRGCGGAHAYKSSRTRYFNSGAGVQNKDDGGCISRRTSGGPSAGLVNRGDTCSATHRGGLFRPVASCVACVTPRLRRILLSLPRDRPPPRAGGSPPSAGHSPPRLCRSPGRAWPFRRTSRLSPGRRARDDRSGRHRPDALVRRDL
jgi:hypothetical protein